jgi:maltose alpha-D-glucosyltransferase/alpha-amylase
MSRYLTSQGFANAPALLGEVSRIDRDGERHVLAVAQAFVRNQGDAWTWALNQANRAFDATASREASAEARGDDIRDYHALAATIGRQLGNMHVVLARPTDDPDFAPQRATAADVDAWIERASGLLARAFDTIAARGSWDNETVEADAKALLANREALNEKLRQLGRQGEGGLMTRIHGDFHLGQVLVAQGDAVIVDFEGEPARGLAERRAKTSPAKDVAGLLRSFDYAAAMLSAEGAVVDTPLLERRRAALELWREAASAAFLEAYRTVAEAQQHPWLRASEEQDIIDIFLIEKVAYEIGYEIANRPAWLQVPLRGLDRLARRLLA